MKVNWSLSFYDHAALEVRLQPVGQVKQSQSRFSRLDPILANPLTKELVIAGFTEMIETMAHDWDPHMKLEFAKVAIRTVCEKVQADRKVRERDEEDSINEELELVISQLAAGIDANVGRLLDYIEELRSRNLLTSKAK